MYESFAVPATGFRKGGGGGGGGALDQYLNTEVSHLGFETLTLFRPTPSILLPCLLAIFIEQIQVIVIAIVSSSTVKTIAQVYILFINKIEKSVRASISALKWFNSYLTNIDIELYEFIVPSLILFQLNVPFLKAVF